MNSLLCVYGNAINCCWLKRNGCQLSPTVGSTLYVNGAGYFLYERSSEGLIFSDGNCTNTDPANSVEASPLIGNGNVNIGWPDLCFSLEMLPVADINRIRKRNCGYVSFSSISILKEFILDFVPELSWVVISVLLPFRTSPAEFTCLEKCHILHPVIFASCRGHSSSLVSQLDVFHVASDSLALGGLVWNKSPSQKQMRAN